MRAAPRLLNVLVLLLLGGCASAFNLEAMRGREQSGLPTQNARSPDGHVVFDVEAKEPPTFDAHDGALQLTIPIGTEQPVLCFLYNDAVGPAELMKRLSERLVPAERKRKLRSVDIDVADGLAGMSTTMDVTFHKGGNVVHAEVSIATYDLETRSLACIHDEVGYNATFLRVAHEVALTLRAPPPEGYPDGLLVDLAVFRISVGGKTVGFSKQATRRLENGAFLELERTAIATLVSDDKIAPADTLTVSSSVDGMLVAIRKIEGFGPDSGGGQLSVDINDDGAYEVEGSMAGKPVEGNFTTETPLLSLLAQRNAIKEQVLAKDGAGTVTVPIYVSREPLRAVPHVFRRGATERQLVVESDGPEMQLTVDENAYETKVVVPAKGGDLVIEKVFHKPVWR